MISSSLYLAALFSGLLLCSSRPCAAGGGKTPFLENHAITIEIVEPAITELKGRPRAYVPAVAHINSETFTNVALRLKGKSSFRPIDGKPGFTIKLDKWASGQNWNGLTKIHLNNCVNDQSHLREYLAAQVYQRAGVPAARVTHVRVRLNGRDLGLYALVEGMNEPFLKQHFRDSSGNLYEGAAHDIDSTLEQNSGSVTDQKDLAELAAATRLPRAADRWKRLNELLDVESFIKFVAAQTLTAQGDGYMGNKNNYRIYHNPVSGKMVFMPHGLDGAFDSSDGSIMPFLRQLVVTALMQTPEGRFEYRRALDETATKAFHLPTITNQLNTRLSLLLSSTTNVTERTNLQARADELRDLIVRRHNQVRKQLADPPLQETRLEFGKDLLITNWYPRFIKNGELKDLADSATSSLYARCTGAYCRLYWGSRILLGRGKYEFLASVKTANMLTNQAIRSGAFILASPGTGKTELIGNAPATLLTTTFDVPDGGSEIELLCQLQAVVGEAWFDRSSLRVRRKD